MDSFFEYLVILFFIFSILQGIFSKKKKEAEKKQPPANSPKQEPVSQKKIPQKMQSKQAEEILGEIFGIPIPKKKPETQTETKTQTYENYERSSEANDTWDPASEFGIESPKPVKKSPSFSEKSAAYDRAQSYSKVKIPVPENLEKQSAVTSAKLKRIKKMLRNKQSVRDMIIAQEILNKPKAFRD